MFIDKIEIYIKAGDGGNGCVSFRREKYVSQGGPDGGDGGRGGSIIFEVDRGSNTLLAFRYKRKFVAQNGDNGKGEKFHGKYAEHLFIKVPPGTLIRDAQTGKIIKDMSDDEPFVCCKGGRGGWGNKHFATPSKQVPMFAKKGTAGEERTVILELKMLADVGLLGMPNVGKSSILSRISSARPKIADYHFTTLSPNLGVVKFGDDGFVVADIPGLIEGASDGIGLGHAFLRHVDRCRLHLHVVDISGSEGRDPIEDIKLINAELQKYSPELASRPQIIIANKSDMLDEEAYDIKKFEDFVDENGWDLLYVSAATGQNLDSMINLVGERLRLLPPLTIYDSEIDDTTLRVTNASGERNTTVRKEDDKFIVEGEWLINLMGQVNLENYDSLNYFSKVITKAGVIKLLEENGAVDGDTVSIYDFEFDFIK